MILLPVIERELRAAARSRATYRNRFLAALAVLGVTVWVFYERNGSAQHVIGKEVFESVSLTALFVALLAGLFSTSDSISEERREGTLGLLYLTDLRSGHVVLGKLVANSIPAFFALAVIVPLLGIPSLLGGVTPGEMTRTALALLNALWFSVTAGLLGSTLSKDDRVTRLMTFIILFLFSIVAPVVGATQTSAFWTWENAQDSKYAAVTTDFWIAMSAQFAVACVCLGFAAWRARVIWQEKPETVLEQKAAEKWRVWSAGTREERKLWRTELMAENPALWLACRRRSRTALLWGIVGIGIVALFWIWQREHRIDAPIGFLFSAIFHLVIKVSIAFAAGRGLSDEARTGALELLLTTDLSPRQLTRGLLSGLVRSFGAAVIVVVITDALWITMGRVDSIFSREFKMFLWWRIGFLFLDCVALAFYGLWQGMQTQRAGRAALKALALVMVVPNVLGLMLMSRIFGLSRPYLPMIGIWILMDVVLIALALGGLKKLREKAAEQFSPNSRPG